VKGNDGDKHSSLLQFISICGNEKFYGTFPVVKLKRKERKKNFSENRGKYFG
jgi:hypothetical protein